MNILCDDIIELIGKEVEIIRNYQWWIDNYDYHLPHNKFSLSYKQLHKKDINSIHASLIAKEFIKFQSWKDSDLIPKFWPGILNYTLYNWHDICMNQSYQTLPSKRCMKTNYIEF